MLEIKQADSFEGDFEDDESSPPQMPRSSFWRNEAAILMKVVTPLLLHSALQGAETSANDVQDKYGIGVQWDLVNTKVADWSRSYGYDLVKGITESSRDYLRQEIPAWIASGAPLKDLISTLKDSPMFDERRAESIGATEVTRSFASGNTEAWQSTEIVKGRTWMTAQDELVCPICSALDGQEVDFGDSFEDDDGESYDAPPAHPNCRCYLQPVVE